MTGVLFDGSGEPTVTWRESASGLLLPGEPERPKAIDLFCGCGGFSLGILEAGFDVVAAVDNDCAAAYSYLINLGAYPLDMRFVAPGDRDRFEKHLRRGLKRQKSPIKTLETSGSNRMADGGVGVFWLGDVSKLTGKQLLDSVGLKRGELDLLFGGPPCQGYSVAGRRNVLDPRNSMVFEFARLVCEISPRAICMENVPGMLSMTLPDGGSVVDEFCRILERGDYGEFEAFRSIMTGERRVMKRTPGKREKRKSPSQPVQGGLFDEDTELEAASG